jgi:mycothiol synthase
MEWKSPKFDLEKNTRVAVTPEGEVAAYYAIWDTRTPPVRMYLWGRVHHEHEGRGLGTALMDWGIERAHQSIALCPESARVILEVTAPTTFTPAHRFFKKRGFSLVRHFLHMEIHMTDLPPKPSWPKGIAVRTFERDQDLREVIKATRESFRDHWGYVDSPFEDSVKNWINWIENEPEFNPDLWFIAEDSESGEIAGVSLCFKKLGDEPELGWVETLGVRRPYRRRGVGLALLYHSFRALYETGQRKAALGVDARNLTGATRLYEKAGMHPVRKRQESSFEMELRPGTDLSTRKLDT